ncbi:MAG: hypothetical protein FJ091_21705 [Deltaproteobacteria bacterium]|nr:hypothetical protein [Deltaproteobacteria bacterium]
MSETLDGLLRLVRERFPRVGEIDSQTRIVADLALDSIQQIDLLVELENHFAIALELEDDGVDTLGELAACIDRARSASRV